MIRVDSCKQVLIFFFLFERIMLVILFYLFVVFLILWFLIRTTLIISSFIIMHIVMWRMWRSMLSQKHFSDLYNLNELSGGDIGLSILVLLKFLIDFQ